MGAARDDGVTAGSRRCGDRGLTPAHCASPLRKRRIGRAWTEGVEKGRSPRSRAGRRPRRTSCSPTGRAKVTNQGGRPSQAGDTTVGSAGTKIVADPVTGGPATGTVSVVDL